MPSFLHKHNDRLIALSQPPEFHNIHPDFFIFYFILVFGKEITFAFKKAYKTLLGIPVNTHALQQQQPLLNNKKTGKTN